MGEVLWDATMSLDGFIAGPGDAVDWVLTHDSRPNADVEEVLRTLGAMISFISGDIGDAVARAREAAAGKNVVLIGASVARQGIDARLVDEILIHLSPILLGDGVRFFSRQGGVPVELELIRLTQSGQLANLRFRVGK
jgi:dihydrofolate reductase